ncbi:MAG TPA: isoprenylcysteine carboxylmethyltransferase family protein [Steroidobacteraceae bacterium]
MTTNSPATLPRSATHAVTAWACVASTVAAIALLTYWPLFEQPAYQALVVMAASALGAFLPDMLWQKVFRRALSAEPHAASWSRVLTKYVGLAGTVAAVAALYGILPEYSQGGDFYGNYWTAIRAVLPLWALVALPYIYWVDRRMTQPRDALWQMGRLVLGRWRGLDTRVLWQYALGWLVKAFFLPLMFTYFCDGLGKLLHYHWDQLSTFQGFYDWSYFTLYFIDVALVSMTYLMALRATDTHIRSSEPTALGWFAALICYQPFWSLVGRQYLDYDTGAAWGARLSASPWAYTLWGCAILALIGVYLWATIAFGARFSNLTHRGIITSGPYRFTKHPAYLAKNLSWWLISVPFAFDTSLADTLRRCCLLLLLNGVYYLRAKTEERHLALDPVYVQYACWIEQHGMLRFLDRLPAVGALAKWRPVFAAYVSPCTFTDVPPDDGLPPKRARARKR